MPLYHLFRVDEAGKILDFAHLVEADDDTQAKEIATGLSGNHSIVEVWTEGRLVGHVPKT
jgi:hypothetical protein